MLTMLFLLLAANGAPIIARNLLGLRLAWPLDGGWCLGDGRRLLGPHKTLRGVGAAVAASAIAALMVGLPVALGAMFGLWSMAGDALGSFIKRRLDIGPGRPVLGLDQGLEAVLPLVALRAPLALRWTEIVVTAIAFFVVGILLSRILYRMRIRRRPS